MLATNKVSAKYSISAKFKNKCRYKEAECILLIALKSNNQKVDNQKKKTLNFACLKTRLFLQTYQPVFTIETISQVLTAKTD